MSAAATAAAGSHKQQPFGPVGDASQLVEAALQARVAASRDQQFATTKTLFFALSSLCDALRLELRMKKLGQVGLIQCWHLTLWVCATSTLSFVQLIPACGATWTVFPVFFFAAMIAAFIS